MVLATGGGAFINDATRALILDKAHAIWLDANIDTLVDRVSRRNTRPMLVGRDPGDVLRELAAVRNPLYAMAHMRIESNNGPHDATVSAIMKALERGGAAA
jgi:shikimate kinase